MGEEDNKDLVAEAAEASAPAGAPAAEKEEEEIPKPEMNVKPPNENEFNAKVEEVQARMEGLHKRIQEIKETLDAREGLRNASHTESGQARQRLQELRAQSRALAAERSAIYDEINTHQEGSKARSAAVGDLKKAIPYASVEEIDRAIKEKEHYQETNPLTLQQVKKVMA
mmetsp:Transcript_15531/g.41661  ORF Transcript_15531/g.41661 Transcript_15531/m.41661 type:complete len:170 (+) Transcript_15531:79-588(+)